MNITVDFATGVLKCYCCGVEEVPPFSPAPINIIIDAIDVFTESHRNCAKNEAHEAKEAGHRPN